MDKHLLQKIEQCRKELIALSVSHHLTSDVMVEASRKLDKLLNEYRVRNITNN
ncbi:aspartyl-phosphate phosphatase Spo0E family protein [Ornithinibacillus contaminans]|uniref:aspartyl-phosphate phosphatase Spo0E family protein n=1 Tax=Ornithinibacillus contaminans TaxID=694055 RepID=UPI0009FB06D7|nr:aspartyl-phosphate phosphatase Spo0E family protein [Ornithinibacillus contaminans]